MAGDVVNTVYGPMSAEFAKSSLADLCVPNVGIQTGPFGSQLHASDYVELGTPIITVEHLGENRIIHSNLPRVTDEDKERLSRYTLISGDIVFSRVGSVDRRAIVHPEEDGWLFSGRCLRVRPNRKKVDPGFLSWFFGLPGLQEHIRQIAVGATMPSLNTKILGDVPIYYPPSLKEQQAIACILGALDDKIELNRRMNRTLEATARAIFKSWFVDFLPVRGNMARTQTGDPVRINKDEGGKRKAKKGARSSLIPHPSSFAALFPDAFEDSELGEIPKGWEIGSVYAAAEVIYGAPFASAKFNSDGIGKPLIRIRDLANESPGVFTTEEHPKGYLVTPGDIVVGMDGEFRAHLWGGDKSWLNQRVCVFKPKAGFSAPFVLHSIVGLLAEVEATETATTVIHLGKNDIDRFKITVPADPILTAFGRLAEPLFQRVVVSKQESRTLAALRDALLPKLISGDLQVLHAARIVGRCT